MKGFGQQVHEADKQFIFCLFSFSCRSFIGERKTWSKHVSKVLFSSAQDHLSTFFFVWENCTTKTEKPVTEFQLLTIQGAEKNTQHTVGANFKGTQDWEFFWLRFWNLRYFFVSYFKILRFHKKFFLIGPLLGEVRWKKILS